MDTFSSSVSSLTVPNIRRNSADQLYNFKNHPYTSSSHYNFPKPTLISNKTNHPFKTCIPTTRNPPLKQYSSSKPALQRSTTTAHCRASSGYAAALVDIGKHNNNLETLERDVTRLSKWLRGDQLNALMTDPLLGDDVKGGVLKEILSKGKFHKHLVGLLKMLVKKNKVGIVDEVLMEFERIYDELCGTQVVLVSSEMKMEKSEVFGIAKKVQELSGAGKVKVKVRHSFAL